jgi:catechol 2,3-dioxygenase
MPIDAATRIGAIHLTIADLDRSIRFYEERIGARLHRRDAAVAALGTGGHEWLVLHASPSAPRARGTTGLYHFAILVPSRADLARVFRHLVETGTPMQGASDHLVSEAIYLADPDGNGIEIYRDRPRAEWPFVNGDLRMASDPLDIEGLVAEPGSTGPRDGLPDDTCIGHVHLQVSRLAEAERFYREALGFDLVLRYGRTAAFLSAGGYHHHIGINIWAGAGAPAPPPGAIGLKHVVIAVPSEAALAAVSRSLTAAGVPHDLSARELTVADPSANRIILRA